ncbi:MAG: dihydropteroate synthase [Parvularculaceae bacterium]|nr:dihydropteroate synthase [Parvularculaceae bacterium]
MGVINVTPDSFSDGGTFLDPGRAIDHALRLVEDGAAILDIGGESTRPGADDVPVETELARVLPVVRGLAGRTAAAISIDTRKPEVARVCIGEGASIWNDVSALQFGAESLALAARLGCRVVLMHAKGGPRTMQENPRYEDVCVEALAFLESRLETAVRAGIARERLIVDPGIGFGKTLEHNLELLGGLPRFAGLGVPLLVGVSRKRFIGMIGRYGDEEPGPGDRLGGSIAAALAAAAGGASLLRVHDVSATRQALAVAAAIQKYRTRP